MDGNILQLREYHINRGRNKSSTPIYPLVKPEGIIGLEDYLGSKNIGGGVTKVTTLPSTGEEGKIYYNTTYHEYYIYEDDEYKFFIPTEHFGIPIAETIKETSITPDVELGQHRYELRPDTFYDLDTLISTVLAENSPKIVLTFGEPEVSDGDYTVSYIWRVTAPSGLSITVPTDTIIPEASNDILSAFEANHTYEFNVLENVLLVTDITDYSSSSS